MDDIEYGCSYVVTPARPAVSWPSPVEPSLAGLGNSEEPQQVTLGIFPASHIHIRDERADAEGRLAAFARAREESGSNVIDPAAWRAMDTLREEDEDVDPAIATNGTGKASFRLPPPPDQAQSSRAGLAVYPPSIRSRSSSPAPSEVQVLKPLPPRPTLKGGDETAAGITQPLVDEIAAALREWYTRMFTYLARREYELFHIVRGHIEALHLGRRQLLAQTLSAEETTKLRRDCVTRLVRGNIAQGLDVIVRHPTWGALVTVDIDGELDRRSWVSAVRMYALQISLAYLDVGPDTIVPQSSMRKMSMESLSIGPSPTPAGSSFPDLMLPKGSSLGSFGSSPVQTSPPTRLPARNLASRPAKFYHVFLDLRAFVASLCAPHETVELFFSLYNQAQTRFVTEEFCAVLDHHGVLARDPDTRVRTLFTDLVQSDVQDPIWLVCRIVRNGGLKIGANMSTGLPSDSPRRGSEASTFDLGSASFNGNGRGADGLAGHFRRPFGCAVLELTQLSEMVGERSDMSATKEYTMPIFVPTNEAVYSMMHQDVIAGKTREYEKSSR
jgi:dedicator of cytokinesis protein 3